MRRSVIHSVGLDPDAGALRVARRKAGASLTYLNYPFLIPSFGVPVFGLLHAYSLFQATRPTGTTAHERHGAGDRTGGYLGV